MTQLELCNLALLKLGEQPLANMNEESAPAKLARAIFPSLRNGLLCLYPWNFAIQEFDLVRTSGEFILPNGVLRVLEVSSDNYKINGRKIVCNAERLTLRAIIDPGENACPDWFCTLLASRLACEICLPLTDNQAMLKSLAEQFETEFKNAKFMDSASAKNPSGVKTFSLIDQRF
ncbi:MAG: hypothetical protein LBB23_02360 [Rickettsiales bacterium]|jgi:hypothetical protein|nr:hypothetical protein [Rickettsiales bacterium]